MGEMRKDVGVRYIIKGVLYKDHFRKPGDVDNKRTLCT